jgi:hypothetical protein
LVGSERYTYLRVSRCAEDEDQDQDFFHGFDLI